MRKIENSSDQVANKEDSIVTVSSTNSSWSIGTLPDRTEDLKLLYGNFETIDVESRVDTHINICLLGRTVDEKGSITVSSNDESWSIGSIRDRTEDLKLLFGGAKSLFLEDFDPGKIRNMPIFIQLVSPLFCKFVSGMEHSTPTKLNDTGNTKSRDDVDKPTE